MNLNDYIMFKADHNKVADGTCTFLGCFTFISVDD